MIEAAMIWNEPNNNSYWDSEHDPEFAAFATLAQRAGQAIGTEAPGLTRVLGGISPIDPEFLATVAAKGGLTHVDAVAVHGFPMDWNLWPIAEWPLRVAEISASADLPVWVSAAGVSSFGAEEVQEWGLRRTAELLAGHSPRVHWFSLYDLPAAGGAATGRREAEGSSYYRHFHTGLFDENGCPKLAARAFAEWAPALGICQWFQFEDDRLEQSVRLMRDIGTRYVRTGLSWADAQRPGALAWFDRQMRALEHFDVTVTFCFTPDDKGVVPHYNAPPRHPEEFADFCAHMVRRYAPGRGDSPSRPVLAGHVG